jgi:phosphoglycerol transferase
VKRPVVRTLLPYFISAVITTLLLLVALRLPMSRLDVPYSLQGDTLDKLAQIHNVAETGWLFHNDRLGYPFGYDRLDFPRFDSLNYAIMGLIAALTGQSGLAMNLYFILGFYLVAFSALYSLKRLGLDTGPALLCGLLYSFLPYHVLRGVTHLTNGTYFLVPLAMLVLFWLARNQLEFGAPASRRRWVFALLVALTIPLQTPYNGFFFAMLCLVAGSIALAHKLHWRTALPTLALLVAVGAAFMLERVPTQLHARATGEISIVERQPFEADSLSLRLNQVLLPTDGHRLSAVAEAKHGFDVAMKMDAPNWPNNQYLGVLGVLGFAALLWALARAAAGRGISGSIPSSDVEGAVRIAAVFAIAIVLLATTSGVGTLLSYWVTSKVRAYNRIEPFFAFAAVLGTGWLLQATVQRVRTIWLRHALLVVVGTFALWDTTVKPTFEDHTGVVADFDRARDYFESVEQRLDKGAAVFQLPVVWYPEHPPVGLMGDYQEFMPWLLTRSLRFSYGGAHGRPGYAWGKLAEGLPVTDMLARVHSLGFAAILVDTNAYTDDSARKAVTDDLARVLRQPPSISADNRWWLFALGDCCGAPVAQIEADKAPKVFAYAADGTPLSFTMKGMGWAYVAGGWSEAEDWGTWSLGKEARLLMRLDPVAKGAMVLSMDTRMTVGPKVPERRLRILCNGQVVGEALYTQDDDGKLLSMNIPAGLVGDDGLLELQFFVTPQTTPLELGINADRRPLGIGLVEMTLRAADQLH